MVMPSRWQLDCLHARMRSLRTEIGRVTEKQPEHAVSRRIYESLQRLIDEFTDRMVRAERRVDSIRPETLDQLEDRYAIISEQLDNLTALFRSCDRLDSPRIPFEILRSLAIAAREMAGRHIDIIVHLSTDYNYKISSLYREFDRARWDRWWREGERNDDPELDVLLMVFPSYEVGTTLLHAAAAHELAHVLARRWRAEIANAVAPVRTAALAKYRTERTDFMDSATGRRRTRNDEASESAWKLLQYRDNVISIGWVVETFADLVAARLVGPAYLAALDRISVNSRDDISHPPIAIRRELIGQYLGDHFPHVKSDPVWREVMTGGAPAPRGDVFTRCGTEICKGAVSALTPLIERLASPLTDEVSLIRNVVAIREKLQNLAPPSLDIEVTTDAEVSQIFWTLIYGTWYFRVEPETFRQICDRYGWTDEPHNADAAINSLLLHGLQNLEIKAKWNMAIGGNDAAK